MNTYGYVNGNPIGLADRLGLCPMCLPLVPPAVEAIGAAAGAVAIGLGAAAGIEALGNRDGNGWEDEFPGLELPPGMPDNIDPWNDTNTEARVCPTGGPTPDPEDCRRAYTNARDQCRATGGSRLTCAAVGFRAWFMCQGGGPSSRPGDGGGNGYQPPGFNPIDF